MPVPRAALLRWRSAGHGGSCGTTDRWLTVDRPLVDPWWTPGRPLGDPRPTPGRPKGEPMEMSRLQPTGCLPPALAGGTRGMTIKTSRLQPGFSKCPLMSESISWKTWLDMVETFLQKPAEAGSNFGV